jgi:hypothetical protein
MSIFIAFLAFSGAVFWIVIGAMLIYIWIK